MKTSIDFRRRIASAMLRRGLATTSCCLALAWGTLTGFKMWEKSRKDTETLSKAESNASACLSALRILHSLSGACPVDAASKDYVDILLSLHPSIRRMSVIQKSDGELLIVFRCEADSQPSQVEEPGRPAVSRIFTPPSEKISNIVSRAFAGEAGKWSEISDGDGTLTFLLAAPMPPLSGGSQRMVGLVESKEPAPADGNPPWTLAFVLTGCVSGLAGLCAAIQKRNVLMAELKCRRMAVRSKLLRGNAPAAIYNSTGGVSWSNPSFKKLVDAGVAPPWAPTLWGLRLRPGTHFKDQETCGPPREGDVSKATCAASTTETPPSNIRWTRSALRIGGHDCFGAIGVDIGDLLSQIEDYRATLSELEGLTWVMARREKRIADLKEEVDSLLANAGNPPRYGADSTELATQTSDPIPHGPGDARTRISKVLADPRVFVGMMTDAEKARRNAVLSNNRLAQEVEERKAAEARLAISNQNLESQTHEIQESRRIAMSMMEDAVASMEDAVEANETLRKEIAERKKLEEELKNLNDDLERRIDNRTKALQEKQMQLAHSGRLAALGEMATAIAHEIGQPLQVIRASAGILAEELAEAASEPERLRRWIDKIAAQVERASSIINNVRNFARREGTDRLTPISLETPLREAASFFQEQFARQETELDIHVGRPLPEVMANHQLFEQITVNLLSNAHSAFAGAAQTDPRRVSMELSKSNSGGVLFTVEDNGAGMSQQTCERCMEPFFTTKPPGEGTGLGLSILHGIVKEFGGVIDIRSEPGKGTRFAIEFPPAPAAQKENS